MTYLEGGIMNRNSVASSQFSQSKTNMLQSQFIDSHRLVQTHLLGFESVLNRHVGHNAIVGATNPHFATRMRRRVHNDRIAMLR
jgi:hypothetical protein